MSALRTFFTSPLTIRVCQVAIGVLIAAMVLFISKWIPLAVTALSIPVVLAAAGTLTAGLAHEVRSPLNAIGLAAQRIQRKYPDSEECAEFASHIRGEVRRLEEVLREFLELAPRIPLRSTVRVYPLEEAGRAAHGAAPAGEGRPLPCCRSAVTARAAR